MGPQDQPTDRDGVSPAATGLSVREVDTDIETDGDGTPVELGLLATGLVIAPAGPGARVVPTLVGWSHLRGFSAEQQVTRADGTSVQLLEVVVDGGVLAGTSHVRRFAVPAPDLAGFFGEVSTYAGVWRASTAPGGRARPGRRALAMATATALAVWAVLVGAWRDGTSWAGGLVSGSTRRSTPRHGLGTGRRWVPIAAGVLVLGLLAGSEASSSVTSSATSSSTGLPHHGRSTVNRGMKYLVPAAAAPANLPAATAAPEPAPPSLASSPPLQSHEIFGYAPYWTLPESGQFDVQDLTTLAYFSIGVNGDGTLQESGPGWNGYESQDLADLVTRSHAAGDRVVLTVTCFDQSALDAITSSATTPATLSAALIAAVEAKNLDGVNFDFEGEGSQDRTGLTSLITQVSAALHATNAHWQVTMATYASAATDSGGFYDIAALAPALDGFFVMAYDMNDPGSPSPTSPLVGPGFTDTEALQEFTSVVPPQKVILGVPYYGYDWPTSDGTLTATATGGESPLSYATIAAAGNPVYWDPTTQTPWTSYLVGTQWHETFFDDPTSMALKAKLAQSFDIRGLGIWALGMDGNDPAMLAALLGNSPVTKDFTPGPTVTPPSGTTPTTVATSTGTWQGATVPLTVAVAPGAPGSPGSQSVGTLTGVQTSDPTLSCLSSGPPIGVWTFSSLPGVDVAIATQPQDCATVTWTFPTPSGPTTTTSTTAPPSTTTTTSTTAPPSTTTTTTTLPQGGGDEPGPN